VRARQHRHGGVDVGQFAQLGNDHVEHRQQYLLARITQHQRVGQVVDVLAGAGEVHELLRLREAASLPMRSLMKYSTAFTS
jgi:hypothetical protein